MGEVLTLATLVVVLGPTIGRFGGVYVSDVFRLAPETGLRFQRLLDVAYYLVFCGYVLTVVSLRQVGEQVLLTARLRGTLDRVAGLLLLMGVLHALTLAVLPIVGLVASSVFRRDRRRRAGDRAPLPSPMAQQAERVARVMVWVGVGSVVAMTLVGLGMLAGIGVGG